MRLRYTVVMNTDVDACNNGARGNVDQAAITRKLGVDILLSKHILRNIIHKLRGSLQGPLELEVVVVTEA